jgi:nicotinate-nucleotide adenylyltransferase
MRIAFFGGSFDPPHIGHLGIARAAQRALDLDTVLFAPVARQPLKPAGPAASFEDRVEMTRIAIADEPHFKLSLMDAPVSGYLTPNYTAETLIRLHQSSPRGAELYLLLGSDSFAALSKWHRASEIPFLANLIVASRPVDDSAPNPSLAGATPALDAETIAASLPSGITAHSNPGNPSHYTLTNAKGIEASLTLLPDLHYDISATQLRHALQSHAPEAAESFPAAVLAYIRSHHLYA